MKEIRKIDSEVILDDESRNVEGYCVIFESRSNYLGWIEIIHRGAITQDLLDSCDIFCLFNHDPNKVLARSNKGNGSLSLTVDERGVKYSFTAPKTALGDELLEYLKRGDLSASSFAFSMDKKDPSTEKWSKRDNLFYRDIYKIDKLYDVSPVFSPAYSATSCSKRFDDMKATSEEIDNKMNLLKEEIENL